LIETLRLNVDGSVSTLPVDDDEMSVEEDAEAREEEEGEEEVRNDGSRSDGARKGWLWRQNEEPELYSEETREETPEAKRFIAEMGTLHFEQVKAGQIVPAGELAYVLPGACAHLAKHHQRRSVGSRSSSSHGSTLRGGLIYWAGEVYGRPPRGSLRRLYRFARSCR